MKIYSNELLEPISPPNEKNCYLNNQTDVKDITPGNKISIGISLIAKGFSDVVNKIVNMMSKTIDNIESYAYIKWEIKKAKTSSDKRKRKAYIIYHRTKKKRIKKKMLKIMIDS